MKIVLARTVERERESERISYSDEKFGSIF